MRLPRGTYRRRWTPLLDLARLLGPAPGGRWPARIDVASGESADFTAFLKGPATESITVTKATVIPDRHLPSVPLAHVAIDAGLNFVGAGRGWPITLVPTRALIGATLRRGVYHIAYALSTERSGNYCAYGALHQLANGWVGISHGCLANNEPDDEAIAWDSVAAGEAVVEHHERAHP